MATGVSVNSQCYDTYQELKLRKKYKFITFRISDDLTEIIVDKFSESKDYDDFVASLPADKCRFAVYDFEYEIPNEGMRDKILFYIWSPDNARIKDKMMFAASKEYIRKKLDGIFTEIQCTDLSETSHDVVLDKVLRMTG
ncbi:putative COF1-cofilin [Piromyces finnis]|uniref:Cofilin n=1 Tax=Piromyces finnis TaxID=1754191 RepID=A0A1Y1VBY6_9FUNG|nr:putative COF1-cofilin [Piromyces finnis]|eukprot:ORX50776.1 putative COF1-cofilin [Piromyces finnis]